MADVKISNLPAATTPLAGTEEIPLVQSGATKKATVNDVVANAVTAVTATSPLASSGGKTPNLSIPKADATTSGYLSSTDWNTFNNKGNGTVTAVTGTSPIVSSGGTTPAISIPAAGASTSGYLTSTDWNTFNNKQPAGSYLTSGGPLGTPSSGTATNLTGLPLTTGVTGVLPVANGGSGTATPSLVAGTNVTISGTWPNQTINATGGGGSGTVTSVNTGTGLTGGPITTTGTIALANTTVTPGTYTAANITVDAQGRITAAANGSGGGGGTVTSVNVSGGTTGLTTSGGPITTAGSITLDGTLAVANGGTGATTAGTARSNLGAAASGANSDITSMSGITGAIGTLNYAAFNTSYATTLAAGQLGWDGNNTLGLGMAGGNVIQRIGEDQYFYVKASTAITKSQVVMFTGAVGASGVPTGAPATGVTDGSYIMGVAAEDIALNGFGLVQFEGTLKNVSTVGYVDGDILWYDPAVAGGLTKTKPSAPNVKVQMAAVINGGSSGAGSMLVRVSPGSVLGGTDSNVQFGALVNGNLIQYNASLGYWQNVTPGSITGVGSLANALTIGTGLTGTSYNGSSAVTVAIDSTVVTTSGTQTLTGKTISGASNTLTNIGNGSLTNSSVTVNGTAISLGASGTVTVPISTGVTGLGTGVATALGTAIGSAGAPVVDGGALGTPSSGTLTNATGLPLSTGVTGTLGVPNGGTGATTLTGILKGNGTSAFTAATAGTDYVASGTATTFTATQTFSGTSSTFAASLLDANETVNVVAAAPSATTNFYVQSGSVQYYTSNAANNWTLNIAFSSGTSLNTALATGQSVTFTLITTQGSTAYYANAITIDGTSVTPKWIGGAPTAGNASGLDVYRFAVVKTASATYTVLASLTQYK